MLALEWLKNAHGIMEKLEATQLENIKKAATVMADSIEAGRWVHTFGCGHATIPVEEMYPRIGSFVGFHPLCELPLTFFTQIIGQMGIHQFLFLERAEGYGQEIMKNYDFDSKDCMWIFSHTRYTSPENPMKAMARIPAVISAIGTPLKALGTSSNSSLSRMPAKSTSARANPSAVATE